MSSVNLETRGDSFDLATPVGTKKVWLIKHVDGEKDRKIRVVDLNGDPDTTLVDVLKTVSRPENIIGARIRGKGIRGMVEGTTTVVFNAVPNVRRDNKFTPDGTVTIGIFGQKPITRRSRPGDLRAYPPGEVYTKAS